MFNQSNSGTISLFEGVKAELKADVWKSTARKGQCQLFV